MQIALHWFQRAVCCISLSSCLLSWSESLRGPWYPLHFLLVLNKSVICWWVGRRWDHSQLTSRGSSFPICHGAGQRMLPISGKRSKAVSIISDSACGCWKFGTCKQVSNSVSSFRKLTWIPFYLSDPFGLLSLALCQENTPLYFGITLFCLLSQTWCLSGYHQKLPCWLHQFLLLSSWFFPWFLREAG